MGNYTNTYATVKPVNTDIAQGLIDNDFKYRAEKRLQEDQDEEKAKVNDEKVKELAKYKNQIKPYDTESPTANTVIINAIAKKQDEMLEWFKVANDRTKGNEERMNAQAKLEDAKNYPEKLKLITEVKTKEFQDYKARRDKGEIYENPQYEDLFKNGYSGIQIGDDEQGNPALMFFDKDGDGIKDVEKFESFSNINRPDPFMKRFSYDKLIDEAAKTMGSDERIIQNGYTTTESKKVLDHVINQTALQLSDNPEMMASFARDFGYENYNNLSDTEKTDLSNRIKADLLARTDKKFSEKFDLAAQDRDAKRAQDAAEKAKDRAFKASEGDKNRSNRIAVKNSGKGQPKRASIEGFIHSGVQTVQGEKKDGSGKGMGRVGDLPFAPPDGTMTILSGNGGIEEKITNVILSPNGEIVGMEGTRYFYNKQGKEEKKSQPIRLTSKDMHLMTPFIQTIDNPKTGKAYNKVSDFAKDLYSKRAGTKAETTTENKGEFDDL